jgi:DNA-directed RNA polymerase sigma subunit (sigma70/sigma32)
MQRNTGDFYSYAQIGDVLGLSPESVRLIERKALAKVRKTLMRRGVRVEHFFDDVRRQSRKP